MSLLGLTLLFLLSAPFVAAKPIAFTSLPPDENNPVTVYSIFGSDYDYLFDGGATVANLNNGKVSISAYSAATQRVDFIGVQVTLQQWTGSTWIDVYKSPNKASQSSANTYRNHEVEVSKGYYYRAKSYHWIQHDDTKEEGTLYTGSILIPDK